MKNDTRERLIEAARDLFLKQGYASTGIAQILEAADAGSGSLYYFFPTKEDLLLAVLEWYKANLIPAVVQPVFGHQRSDRTHLWMRPAIAKLSWPPNANMVAP